MWVYWASYDSTCAFPHLPEPSVWIPFSCQPVLYSWYAAAEVSPPHLKRTSLLVYHSNTPWKNCKVKVKVKVVIYNSISAKAHGTWHLLSAYIATHSFTVTSPWGEYIAFSAAEAIHTVPIFRSTWFPLLLGGHRWCRFKAYPRLLFMTSAEGIEPQTR